MQTCSGTPDYQLSSPKYAADMPRTQVARLAMVSQAAVFRDIVPGYRVRLPTEKELAMPVSKDVRRVRDTEAALLRAYQARPSSSFSLGYV